MCVWQSHAPAGTSKFTGVAGCALAKPNWVCVSVPAATAATMKSRLVIIVFSLGWMCIVLVRAYVTPGVESMQFNALQFPFEKRPKCASLQLLACIAERRTPTAKSDHAD